MTDPVESLMVEVRANTQGFARDVAQLRATFDTTLGSGLAAAGGLLERSLGQALRRGSLGFADLQRVALAVLDTIAQRAATSLFAPGATATSGGAAGLTGLAGLGIDLLGGLLGRPGRATGGPVVPGQGYLVGERGPELFVPGSVGRVVPGPIGREAGREVRVAITIQAPPGSDAPQALQRSGRQVAAAVRRALRDS
ncbi:tail tape measure protein [Novosphingobium piscinae]|uniref:Tail tape measure protein n=1 Tax=Novosphingobium piscinae TaxID=1507448 RepID=A0A7X1KRT5_9SPHN|nr:tail tape measure protein [Novosphingobium piscinae]MBC2670918.1 tail tape measure protein [Novosphingobium piscinae]